MYRGFNTTWLKIDFIDGRLIEGLDKFEVTSNISPCDVIPKSAMLSNVVAI